MLFYFISNIWGHTVCFIYIFSVVLISKCFTEKLYIVSSDAQYKKRYFAVTVTQGIRFVLFFFHYQRICIRTAYCHVGNLFFPQWSVCAVTTAVDAAVTVAWLFLWFTQREREGDQGRTQNGDCAVPQMHGRKERVSAGT